MPIIGIDDTDSSTEMCTTYLTIEILKNSTLDLIGYPRLVRLNPNIPLKTRGNAAISITLGRGHGDKKIVGKIGNNPVNSFSGGEEEKIDIDIFSLIERFSPKDEKTNPALIIARERNNENFYWDAVREFVDYRKVKERTKGEIFTSNGDVGIVGANASISWPEGNSTFEIIAYLDQSKWKGEHYVDPVSSMHLERDLPDTFDNFDFRNYYNAIRPTTKTPVLFGIRGVDPLGLLHHITKVKSEPYSSFITYKTNQATDDHLTERTIARSKLYHSSIIHGFVSSSPASQRGGLVKAEISAGNEKIVAVGMEPTREFRNTLSLLRKGDEVKVYGGITREGFINIEKIHIISLSHITEVATPSCPKCRTKMESVGRNGGFRCRKCGRRSRRGEERAEKRDLKEGFYEVPILARRHLARPLKLGNIL